MTIDNSVIGEQFVIQNKLYIKNMCPYCGEERYNSSIYDREENSSVGKCSLTGHLYMIKW